MRFRFAISLVALPVVVGSCGGVDAPERVATVEWQLDSLPAVTIGGDDERLDYIVYGVVGATRLSDGRIAVASQSASEIRYYSPDGVHLSSSGGPGSGPGEFQVIFAARRVRGDTLLVISRSPGVTWLGPTGEYVRSVNRSPFNPNRHRCRIHGDATWHSDGGDRLLRVFDDNPGQPGCKELTEGLSRHTGLVDVSMAGTDQFDTLAVLPSTERNGGLFRVFGGSLLVATSPGRAALMDSRADTIVVYSLDGDHREAWPAPFESRPVPDEAKLVSNRDLSGFPPGARVPSGYAYPAIYPTAGRMLFDEEGSLWVMEYPEANGPVDAPQLNSLYSWQAVDWPTRWAVLNDEGRVEGRVVMPPGLFPMEIGRDYVLGVTKDEYGVEQVQLHRLQRR